MAATTALNPPLLCSPTLHLLRRFPAATALIPQRATDLDNTLGEGRFLPSHRSTHLHSSAHVHCIAHFHSPFASLASRVLQSTASAIEDWATDARGMSEMGREAFMDSIFELADVWTGDYYVITTTEYVVTM